MFWSKEVKADRTMSNNKPAIIICDNEKGICLFVDSIISEVRKKPDRF